MFLEPLGRSYRLLCNCHFQSPGGTETTSAWFGSQELSPVNFLKNAKVLLDSQLLGNHNPRNIDRLGYKEIQYIDLDKGQLFDHLDFLRLLCPNHKFIVHTRNHESVAKSGWWANQDHDDVLNKLSLFEGMLTEYFDAVNPNHIMYSNYENLTGDIDRFCSIISEFFQTDVPPQSLKWALSKKHSLKSEEVA